MVGQTSVEIPEKGNPPVPNENDEQAEVVTWSDFTQSTTFHGIKYIFQDTNLKFRRLIWLTVVITFLLVFVIQVGIRTGVYFQYRTTVDVGVVYRDRLEFPAVTICNQNTFRITATVEFGLYEVIDEVFRKSNISEIPWPKFGNKINTVDFEKFTLETGHQKELFIDSCTWNGIECDINSDFETMLTDLGLCYTFNARLNSTGIETRESGAGSGLKLVINVEQYEYMRGPQSDAGVKILLHPRQETPIMSEHGFAAAPGTHTLVAMKRYEVKSLEPPYGICNHANAPITQCHAQCRTRDVIKKCGCRAVYMQTPGDNETKICDFKASLSCTRTSLAHMRKSEMMCECNPPCLQVRYEPHLSYAQLSKFNIDRMILDNPEKKKVLQDTYLKARETTQRYREEIRVKDTSDMQQLLNIAESLHELLQNYTKLVDDPVSTAKYYSLPQIFLPEFLKTDIDSIRKHIDDAYRTLYSNYPNYFYMDHMVDYVLLQRILEWDGSVSKFTQVMIACMEEAAIAPLNGTLLDGSGDVDSSSSSEESNETMVYGSEKCKEDMEEKKDIMDNYKSSFKNAFIVDLDIKHEEDKYMKIIDSFFENSTKSANDFEDHRICVRMMDHGDEIEREFAQLYNFTEHFRTAETWGAYISATESIINIIQSSFMQEVIKNVSRCQWLGEELGDIIYRELEVYDHHRLASQTSTRVLGSYNAMSNVLVSMAFNFEMLINPIFKKVSSYLNGTGTKTALSIHLHSPLTTKILGDLSAFETDVYSAIKSLQENLDQFEYYLNNVYYEITDTRIPIVSVDKVKELELFKQAAATNRTHFEDLLNGTPEGATGNLATLLRLIFSEYDRELQELLKGLLGPFKEIAQYLSKLRSSLSKFAESSSLNENFFMENFLQVDIFYKDMSYEQIAQQQAFELLSLLGEVGGFMGLLLGASVITVCELLDYLILNCMRTCARRRQVAPTQVMVKSIWP